jgi:hypothetical protein
MPAGSGTLGPATSFKNNTRLSAAVALFSADPAKAEFANSSCGTAVLRHCGSTLTMGTSMVDEYPTLFRDSLLFGLFCLPSLTFS